MRPLALLTVLFFSFQALAGPFEYRFKVFPRGEKCEASDHWCYTLKEFKLLIEYDSELSKFRAEVPLLKEKLRLRTEMGVSLSKQLGIALDSISILHGENNRLTELWKKTDKELQECKYDSPLWPWIVLGIGGAALLAGVGIIVGVYASGGGK